MLGTCIGSVRDEIIDGRTGLLFEPRNTDDLAEKIDYLINHKSRLVQMGREARRIVEQKCNPTDHYNRLMTVYNKLVCR